MIATSSPPITIRVATEADLPDVVALGQACGALMPYLDAPLPPDRLMRVARQMLVHGGAFLVAEADSGTLVGVIGLLLEEHPLVGGLIATELPWFVLPAASSGTGAALLHAAEAWARAQGAVLLHVAAPTPEMERLCRRAGYTAIETHFQRRL